MTSPRSLSQSAGGATPLWQSLGTDKQDLVFQAAVEEFAEHGYGSASMNTLVKRAGISKGSLFTYFRSKSGLFDAVVEQAAGRVRADLKALRERTRQDPFPHRLEALVRTGFTFLDAHPHLARIYFRLLQGGDAPLGRSQAQALRKRSQEFLEELITEGQQAGELRRDLDARRMAFLLNLELEALLAAWQERVPRGARGRPALREEWIGDFVSLARRGMQAGSGEGGS